MSTHELIQNIDVTNSSAPLYAERTALNGNLASAMRNWTTVLGDARSECFASRNWAYNAPEVLAAENYWVAKLAGAKCFAKMHKSCRMRLINCLARNAPFERSLASLTERQMRQWPNCGKTTIKLVFLLKSELSRISVLPMYVEGAGGI